MDVRHIETAIYDEIMAYPFTHDGGSFPERVFLSRPLYKLLEADYKSRAINLNSLTDKECIATMFGIRIEVYDSEEYEFYLAHIKRQIQTAR